MRKLRATTYGISPLLFVLVAMAANAAIADTASATRDMQTQIWGTLIVDLLIATAGLIVLLKFMDRARDENKLRLEAIKENTKQLNDATVVSRESLRHTSEMNKALTELVITLKNRPCMLDSGELKQQAIAETTDEELKRVLAERREQHR